MGLFNKILGNKVESNTATDTLPKIKKAVQDFFLINLIQIPDDTFVEGEIEVNEKGETTIHYRKNLDYLEAGIFDTIEVLKIPNTNSKTIWFQSFDLSKANLNKVKELIDSLYLINGVDDLGNGKFNSEDEKHYYSKEYDVLFTRMWGSGIFQGILNISRENNTIQLTLFNP